MLSFLHTQFTTAVHGLVTVTVHVSSVITHLHCRSWGCSLAPYIDLIWNKDYSFYIAAELPSFVSLPLLLLSPLQLSHPSLPPSPHTLYTYSSLHPLLLSLPPLPSSFRLKGNWLIQNLQILLRIKLIRKSVVARFRLLYLYVRHYVCYLWYYYAEIQPFVVDLIIFFVMLFVSTGNIFLQTQYFPDVQLLLYVKITISNR